LVEPPEEDQQTRIAKMQFTKHASNPITTKEGIRADLKHIQAEGFAVNDEELAASSSRSQRPVHSGSWDVIAAINMAAHISMIPLEELVGALMPRLVATADRISAQLASGVR
jgi:IclR family pca regulon transcriptional regulator